MLTVNLMRHKDNNIKCLAEGVWSFIGEFDIEVFHRP